MKIILVTFAILLPFGQYSIPPVGGDGAVQNCNPKLYRC